MAAMSSQAVPIFERRHAWRCAYCGISSVGDLKAEGVMVGVATRPCAPAMAWREVIMSLVNVSLNHGAQAGGACRR